MITAKGQVTRQMVADELNVSRATAGRLLVGLEAKGLVVSINLDIAWSYENG